MDEAGDSDSTGPSPEQVLDVFRTENAGVVEVTPELCRLTQMLTPQTQAQLSEQLALASDAARGWQMLRSALIVHVPALRAALQEELAELRESQPERFNEPIATEPRFAASFSDYLPLRDLLAALESAAETVFLQSGAFGDTTRWGVQCTHLFAAVQLVLERSGHEPGFSAHGPACRVTAALFRTFLGRSETTPDAVSSLVRTLRRKHSGKTEPEWQ